MAMKPRDFDYMMVIQKRDVFEIDKWLYATFGPVGVLWTSNYSMVGKNSVVYFKREQDLAMAQLRWS